MSRHLRWALRVVAQFVVAGGFTRAIDAWIVDLEPRWQLTVLALTQLIIAIGQACLTDQASTPRALESGARSRIERAGREDQRRSSGR